MRLVYLLLSLIIYRTCDSTLSKDDKKVVKVSEGEPEATSESVIERRLVSTKTKWKDIVGNHAKYFTNTEVNKFKGQVLGYVTPWNSVGYDVAKQFGNKFAYISPVWLQIKREQQGGYSVHGGHDIDQQWISSVKGAGRNVKLVPRVLFDGWSLPDYQKLFGSKAEKDSLAAVLVDFMKKEKFDGFVLEVWSQLAGYSKTQITKTIVHLAKAFHRENKSLVLVIPPAVSQGSSSEPGAFVKADFDELEAEVDAFSLMTYDFSNPQRPGPNSPIAWVQSCVESLVPVKSELRSKILLGLNFYGYDYSNTGGGPVLGKQFVELLKKHKPQLTWIESAKEHMFEYKSEDSKHVVFFPTLQSISDRIVLAERLGTGLSIWEIGQGLTYFYDLL